MDALLLAVHGLALALQLLCFVLDVNFWLVSTLLTVCLWGVAFVTSLPSALLAGVTCCWDTVVSSMQALARSYSAGLEGLKVIGHLLCHLLCRSKEAVQRGLLNLVLSGQVLAQQTCDVFAIAVSLITYLVNSLLNMCLIGAQHVVAVVLALWDSIVSPFIRVTELFSTLFSRMSSNAIAMAILLWTPCQLAFEMLASTTKVLLNLFFLNLYGLLLLTLLIIIGTLLINPELTSRVVEQLSAYFSTLPSYRRLRYNICRLYQGLLLSLELVRRSETWHSISATIVRIANWNRTIRRIVQQTNYTERLRPVANQGLQGIPTTNQGQRRTLTANQEQQRAPTANWGQRVTLSANQEQQRAPTASQEVSATNPGRQGTSTAYQRQQAVPRGAAEGDRGHQGMAAGQRPVVECIPSTSQQVQPPGEGPGSSQAKPGRKQLLNALGSEEVQENDPWLLLKEQEERKKCVICQDHTKTVLLLPCRHLCLCCECTDILLQQPVYQRSCPLCRQMILQTLNVYL
ncbi:E3 ubiquitin-protein ligase RNF26 [Rhinatrema bivittatum]|uniref:E3 ubiquitin-protein ligase RNF26 n=1 Tax=Rhinatrema bivittatum TaxID=194408 RepID=UPI0011268926|nr:E3 ubiquitin-protein ligase RNF26 [Rhinatrema bivittatum]